MTAQERFSDCLRNSLTRYVFRLGVLLACLCCIFNGAKPALAQQTAVPDKQTNIAALEAEIKQAVQKVNAIVNQPVTKLARTPGMRVGRSPYWFHEGAIEPKFNTVDVRATQEFVYDNYPYTTSDLNPGVVFKSSELEFNSMTKYFYQDRSLPKKRLSEAEMVEINRLYRIIGRCQQKVEELVRPPDEQAELEQAGSGPVRKYEPVPKGNYVKAAIGVSVMLALYFVYRKFR